jgi:hypothetical protein
VLGWRGVACSAAETSARLQPDSSTQGRGLRRRGIAGLQAYIPPPPPPPRLVKVEPIFAASTTHTTQKLKNLNAGKPARNWGHITHVQYVSSITSYVAYIRLEAGYILPRVEYISTAEVLSHEAPTTSTTPTSASLRRVRSSARRNQRFSACADIQQRRLPACP